MIASIYTLSSGSSGNCTYIRCGDTEFLIDAGISRREIAKKLSALGTSLQAIRAIFVTHEHSDHIKGIPMVAKYDKIPIFAHKLTLSFLKEVDPSLQHPIKHPDTITLGDVSVTAFATPHDSLASCGYVITYQGKRFGYATDLGRPTDTAVDALVGCQAVILEANYDKDMLRYGSYPPFLKERIRGNYGHLDNEVAAKFAAFLAKTGTERVLLAHLSDENNTPETAYRTVSEYLQKEKLSLSLAVAARHEISELVTLEC
ncbi:MAG: MBL fold metallo-hydrolase [Clostridia bacterium]|nr:MBL fold metallo-hydrolase [Clostridia bacterium]